MRALRLLANLAGLLALSAFLSGAALLGVFADWRWFGPLLVACALPIAAAWWHRRARMKPRRLRHPVYGRAAAMDPVRYPPPPLFTGGPTAPLPIAMSGRPAVLEGTIVLPTITRHPVIGTARPYPRHRKARRDGYIAGEVDRP